MLVVAGGILLAVVVLGFAAHPILFLKGFLRDMTIALGVIVVAYLVLSPILGPMLATH